MKILLVGLGYRGYPALYSEALAALGHEVSTYVGLRQGHLPTRIRRLAEVRIPAAFGAQRDYLWSEQVKLRRYLRRLDRPIDLLLFANADLLATDDTLAETSERGMPSAVWLLDDIGTTPTSGLELRSFDYLASFNRHQAAGLQQDLERPVLFVPQGLAPITFTPSGVAPSRVLVLGAPYPSRREAVQALLTAGLDVDAVGGSWTAHERSRKQLRLFRDVSLSQSLSISAGGRICVNGHRSQVTGVSPRVFEIGGAGGLIVSDNADTTRFFEPGVEMLHWTDPREAAEHAVRAHRDPKFSARIARNGHRRTLSEHTMKGRFAMLLAGWGFS